MFVWLKWRLVTPLLVFAMALAPVACVLHCRIGAQAQMAHPKAILLGESFMPDCGMSQSHTNKTPLGEMQQTYEQVTQAVLPLPVFLGMAFALTTTRSPIQPNLRLLPLAPEVPPPKNYE